MYLILAGIFDFVCFIFSFLAFIYIFNASKRTFSGNTKISLMLLFLFNTLNFFENILPLYEFGQLIAPFTIYYEIMKPLIWLFFFYALLQEIIRKEIKESEKKALEAYNLSEFYKDLFTHDMNNILQNISFSAALSVLYAKDPKKLDELEKILRISKEQVKVGTNLISNIRKLSKLEAGQISTQPTDAVAVLKDEMEYILKSQGDREIKIEFTNPFEQVLVRGNELLTDVVDNILNNSIKYNDSPVIDIQIIFSKTQQDNSPYLKMEFKDNGIGIQDNKKKVIFQKVDMKGKSLKAVKGMGIGLSIVEKILTSYNGKIWVEDKVKGDYTKGCNFIVLIPLAE